MDGRPLAKYREGAVEGVAERLIRAESGLPPASRSGHDAPAVRPACTARAMSAVRIRRVLDPSERTAEVLFGLIMVLTFTGSLSVVDAGRADVREMLLA